MRVSANVDESELRLRMSESEKQEWEAGMRSGSESE